MKINIIIKLIYFQSNKCNFIKTQLIKIYTYRGIVFFELTKWDLP